MSDDNEPRDDWKAPYVSYETYANFFDKKLAGNIVPPRIDRQFLDNYAGSVQPLILNALRTMGMIDDLNGTQPSLRRAAKGVAERKEVFREWGQHFYQKQIALAEEAGTAGQLHETFTEHGYSGSTLRKAVVFYLALSVDLQLPLSPHFKPPRQPAGSTAASGAGRSGRKTGALRTGSRGGSRTPGAGTAPTPDPASELNGGGERKTINFGDAGTVTIDVNVRWLDLPDDVFRGLRQVVNDLAGLEQATLAATAGTQPATETGDVTG